MMDESYGKSGGEPPSYAGIYIARTLGLFVVTRPSDFTILVCLLSLVYSCSCISVTAKFFCPFGLQPHFEYLQLYNNGNVAENYC